MGFLTIFDIYHFEIFMNKVNNDNAIGTML